MKNIIIIILLLLSYGCSFDSSPSESDGRKIIERLISQQSSGRIQLIDFRKTNGIPRDLLGMHLYEMECESVVELLADCYMGCWGMLRQPNFVTWEEKGIDCRKYEKGSKVRIPYSITFEKTENGWRETH